MKAQHELKIVGVHYAVNPNYQEMEPSPEMELDLLLSVLNWKVAFSSCAKPSRVKMSLSILVVELVLLKAATLTHLLIG